MPKRWRWIAVAFTLVLGAVFALADQACGPNQAVQLLCPSSKTGLYDPQCCTAANLGCGLPCANRALAVCCKEFASCATDDNADPVTNCKDWFDFWCTTPDAGADGATGCAGDCVPLPPFGWEGPGLFWLGDPGAVPACPSNAPATAYQGHTDLIVPDGGTCTACTCSIDGGACGLPATLTAATLRIFGDDEGGGLCTKPRLMELTLSAAGPTCGDLPEAGLAIGSERVVGLEYDAGSCAPGGGQPAGEAAPSGPATFCCLASA